MEEKKFELEEIEQAEAHLKKAEADLEASRAAEHDAEHEVEEALQEIKEALHQQHEIHFTVDGEPEETKRHEMTPNEIIIEYGHKDPATSYLVRIEHGHKEESYEGKGNEPIRLHNGMKFQIISIGPMPVSDPQISTGITVFNEGLVALGYSPIILNQKTNYVVFEYEVQSGRFAGKTVKHGFIVPSDFPIIAPSGPYVSPSIHPINPSNTGHPLGGVHHDDNCKSFEACSGEAWQYWSRPFQDWAQSKKTVAVYMAHIWRLWDSQ